ncbi:MAG: 50S ribosomal protein L9 [Acidobacteria bacterium]|nr:50S ribosomal protein L9 [Acidobacteriota bacterium]MDW7983526.1 50S ribosomal protein L9 [Acidobacteriota bacterium]
MSRSIQVILLQDVPNLGSRGRVVAVRPGFARNYLIPRGLAVRATEATLRQFENLRRTFEQRSLKARSEAEQMKAALEAEVLTITRRAGREDLLFQAVTRDEIARLLTQRGFRVDRRSILLPGPIKRAGIYEVPVHIYGDVRATLRLQVQPA